MEVGAIYILIAFNSTVNFRVGFAYAGIESISEPFIVEVLSGEITGVTAIALCQHLYSNQHWDGEQKSLQH